MNVAVLGLGFMGSTHVKAWGDIPGARVAAVMSSDERKLSGDLTAIEGNLGISGELLDFSEVRKHRSVEEALADPDIDIFDICLPTDKHAFVATAALRAGRHVLVEKPLALDYDSALSLIGEAREAGRILMAAHVLRFIPAYAEFANQARQSGPPLSALFRRRCAAPAWSGWLADPARSGGGVFDLLIHDADFCISLWGMPESVQAIGHENLSNGVDIIHAQLSYKGFGPVILSGGWHHPKSYPFSMEFTVVTESGTYEWINGEDMLRQHMPDGEEIRYPLQTTNPFATELEYFLECAGSGLQPAFCPPEQSAQSIALMRSMLKSRSRNGEPVSCEL